MSTKTESELRAMPTCIACGKAKDNGPVVCWHCFKYEETRFTPLKYWNGDTESWLKHVEERKAAEKEKYQDWKAEYRMWCD